MEIVIKISKEEYNRMKKKKMFGNVTVWKNAICNGTPLPKGHGDLITKEQAIDLVEFYQLNPQHFDFVNLIDEINDEKPIIEADKEDSNG